MANNASDQVDYSDFFHVPSPTEQVVLDGNCAIESSSKPKHIPLPFKDLVQRGDPVPGIYKACDGTSKSFRVFLPSEFFAKKIRVFSSDVPNSDLTEPVLKVWLP